MAKRGSSSALVDILVLGVGAFGGLLAGHAIGNVISGGTGTLAQPGAQTKPAMVATVLGMALGAFTGVKVSKRLGLTSGQL